MKTMAALIADDEPLLRDRLAGCLARLWPGLQIVAQARNGREAVELFDEHRPDIVFLDVHMPGLNGVDAARAMRGRTQIVFVTAFEQYAVAAFEQGAVDYLIKPFDEARLADTVKRLQARLALAGSALAGSALAGSGQAGADDGAHLEPVLAQLANALRQRGPVRAWLQWIKASVGQSVKLIPVDEVAYLKSDEKYTLVAWGGGEALIRKTIRELADELDPDIFVQVHRSVIINLRHVAQVVRGPNETADVHLRGRSDVLPVSRSYLHQFKQM